MSQAVDEVQRAAPVATSVSQRSPFDRKPRPQQESPALPDRGRVMVLAENFERMSTSQPQSPAGLMSSPKRSMAQMTAGRAPEATTDKYSFKASPVRHASQAVLTAPPPPPTVREEEEEDFDDFSIHSEGSDVFPTSTAPSDVHGKPSAAAVAASKPVVVEEAVHAFSPGSVASPPQRTALSISTGAPKAVPYQPTVPDTPDSPWDDESEMGGTVDVSKDEQDDARHGADHDDDTSSVDSEVRNQKKHSPQVAASRLAPLSPTKANTGAGAGSGTLQPMRGPSLASVAQLTGPGSSPAKPLLSGSLLQKGRSSGPNLGGYK